jgi:3-hydroxyacyl-CoA dehydrogenase/enoyl-CoA hydratase/3-hydroxybutyryl-CoA epimerase
MALPAPTASPSAAGAALTWELADGIAVVTFDLKGESVNKISRAVKQDVLATFEALERDAAVQAVAFFSGKAENFIAGADIDEFVTLSSAAEAERLSADGQDLLERVARFPKPVAVGIHGACLGGGLEFALACRYRVASDHPMTQLGLPEVQLGLLPGAGGCQRLPRLIGARAALDIILAGKVEPARKAFRLGIVDELVPPAILKEVTLAAARRMAGGWWPRRKRRGGLAGWVLDGNPLGRRLVFRTARKQVQEKTGGHYPAPLAALEAVEYGLKHGVQAGLKHEAQLFGQLAVTDVSRKLVQIFFATTALKKDPGIATSPPPPPVEVRRLGVVGAGFMGAGIAGTAVAQAGVDVRLKDADLPRVAKGLAAAREILDDRLKRRRITRFEHARLVALISGGDGYAGFGRAELVIEAVFEDLPVKQQVLREVEDATGARAVFASNTSTIPIHRIAEAARRPEQVIGMHFFSPVARMPLLEVIPSERTAPGVISTAVAFGRRIGKTAIVVKDSPGFWINRILTPYMNEAGHLLATGVAIDELDHLMVAFGFPVGPVTLLDEVGMDVAEKVAGVMHEAFGERFTPSPAFAGMVKAGRLGRKVGKGFYAYARGKKGGVDPSVYELIGVQPNGGPRPAEIIQRLVLVMLNEAARAVGEGVVRSPRDGDIGAIFGFGFPPFRGGPLRHADDLGAARVVGELERLAERYGARFAPCEVLEEQARSNRKFYP